ILPAVKASGCKLILEPARFIVGNAGILLRRLIYTKESGDKRYVIQDGGMNDLIRPNLYDAFHRTWPAARPVGVPEPPTDNEADNRGGWHRESLPESRRAGRGDRRIRRAGRAGARPAARAAKDAGRVLERRRIRAEHRQVRRRRPVSEGLSRSQPDRAGLPRDR